MGPYSLVYVRDERVYIVDLDVQAYRSSDCIARNRHEHVCHKGLSRGKAVALSHLIIKHLKQCGNHASIAFCAADAILPMLSLRVEVIVFTSQDEDNMDDAI
eukprot:363899-Chlamydomonas_euryale.AAC.9